MPSFEYINQTIEGKQYWLVKKYHVDADTKFPCGIFLQSVFERSEFTPHHYKFTVSVMYGLGLNFTLMELYLLHHTGYVNHLGNKKIPVLENSYASIMIFERVNGRDNMSYTGHIRLFGTRPTFTKLTSSSSVNLVLRNTQLPTIYNLVILYQPHFYKLPLRTRRFRLLALSSWDTSDTFTVSPLAHGKENSALIVIELRTYIGKHISLAITLNQSCLDTMSAVKIFNGPDALDEMNICEEFHGALMVKSMSLVCFL